MQEPVFPVSPGRSNRHQIEIIHSEVSANKKQLTLVLENQTNVLGFNKLFGSGFAPNPFFSSPPFPDLLSFNPPMQSIEGTTNWSWECDHPFFNLNQFPVEQEHSIAHPLPGVSTGMSSARSFSLVPQAACEATKLPQASIQKEDTGGEVLFLFLIKGHGHSQSSQW